MEVYNTRTSKKEELMTQTPGVVKAYVCGPTVYDYCHIGHARSYINFDVLRRYLEGMGYEVVHIQNFTDVEERITQRAREAGVTPKSLSERFIEEYFKDMDALNVRRATRYPRASEYIPQIVEATKRLLGRGIAYQSGDAIYFDVQSAGGFGELVSNLEGALADRATVKGTGKRGPFDFVLWRAAREGEEGWESPWGRGRPGWHSECVAMSIENLGPVLDIHWGGKDLIFPHHECEALTAKALTGERFVRYWMHNELVMMGGEKMSKSTGRTVLIREVLDRHAPEVLRTLILSKHYRQKVEFDDVALIDAEERYLRLQQAAVRARAKWRDGDMSDCVKEYTNLFFGALDDDLETGQALEAVDRLSMDLLEGSGGSYEGAAKLYGAVEDILGIRLNPSGHQSSSTQ